MGVGSGFGKVILFNEHFVVYGIPAIASAIGLRTTAHVVPSEMPGIVIEDNRLETPGYKIGKLEHQQDSLRRMLAFMKINPEEHKYKIVLGGDLVAASGVGASAASCTAIARALSDELGLGLSDEQINEVAYEGEKGYHGTPSGIDNTASTFGGLIWFKKGEKNIIERLQISKPIEIVMGNTGIVANTKAAVAGVKERKEKEPEKYARIFQEAESLVYKARDALKKYDLREVGALMNKNHELLQQIEVSCDELDTLVSIARENGALGAKMTGGGLGGYMVALTPGKELQDKVADAIEAQGFTTLRTTIGV